MRLVRWPAESVGGEPLGLILHLLARALLVRIELGETRTHELRVVRVEVLLQHSQRSALVAHSLACARCTRRLHSPFHPLLLVPEFARACDSAAARRH